MRGVHTVPKGAYTIVAESLGKAPHGRVLPPEEARAAISFSLKLDFAKGRHRHSQTSPDLALETGKLDTGMAVDTFNGSVEKEFKPKDKNPRRNGSEPELSIVSGHITTEFPCSAAYPIFFGHGRIAVGGRDEIKFGKLRKRS